MLHEHSPLHRGRHMIHMCEGTRYTCSWYSETLLQHTQVEGGFGSGGLCAKCNNETRYSGLYSGLAKKKKRENLSDAPVPYSK